LLCDSFVSDYHVVVEEEAIKALANLCDGDARIALNGLQLAVQSQVSAVKRKAQNDTNSSNSLSLSLHQTGDYFKNGNLPTNAANDDTQDSSEKKTVFVNVSHIKEGLQRTHLLYDRNGEEHYNIISAMHKSIRGGDENAALYWLARMLVGGEDPLYVARRLVRCASEDIGKCFLVSLIIELEDYVSFKEYRLMYQLTSQSSVGQRIGCYICRVSVEIEGNSNGSQLLQSVGQ